MSTNEHEFRDMLGVGPYHLEDDMNMTTCTACGRPAKMWGHDGKCPDCIAATTSFGSDKDETIRAREREATDLRYRVRELNRHLERQQELYDNAQAERDEWKAKAEHYEAVAQRKVNEVESLKSAPHYCCMHMRWETQRGEKV